MLEPQREIIWIVDDDAVLCRQIADYLEQHGYSCRVFHKGAEFLEARSADSPALVLLDVMLPGGNGLEICRQIRQRTALPVIFLSALGEETDRVVGLELGADDYMVKPFSARELLARIRTVLRRAGGEASESARLSPEECQAWRFAEWTLERKNHLLRTADGKAFSLSAAEFRLLRVFLENPHVLLEREFLLSKIQHGHAEPYDRVLDVQVSRLRSRLGDTAREQRLIKTVRGDGYMLVADVERLEHA